MIQNPPETVRRTARFKIVKPVNCSWDAAGKILRAVEKACVNVANATTTYCLSLDYRIYDQVTVKPNGLVAPLGKSKKIKLPEFKEPKSPDSLYAKGRIRFPFMSSSITAAVVKESRGSYVKKRFAYLIGKEHPRTYRNYSIPIHDAVWRVTRVKEGDYWNYHISVPMLSQEAVGFEEDGQPVTRLIFSVEVNYKMDREKKVLDQIIDGKIKKNQIKIGQSNGQWTIFIPYDKAIESHPDLDPTRTLEVYPPGPDENGRARFLNCTYHPSRGQPWTETVEFRSAIKFWNHYDSRAKAISQKYRQDAKFGGINRVGAVGHGRKRALQNKERWQAKYHRVTKTFNQQRAAFIVRCAIKMRCGRIEMVDMTGKFPKDLRVFDNWPYYDLQQCIKNCCESKGITFDLKSGPWDEILDKADALLGANNE